MFRQCAATRERIQVDQPTAQAVRYETHDPTTFFAGTPLNFLLSYECAASFLLRNNLDSIDLRMLFAEVDGDRDGFHQRLGCAAGFFEDVQVLDLVVLDLDGEDALAGGGDLGIGF